MSFGFGFGPFGRDPFGEAAWSRWLYDGLSELYRTADEAEGFPLEAWQEALRGPLDIFRRKIRDFLDLRDPLRVRSQFDEVSRLRLGPRVLPTYPVEQRGFDGQIDAIRAFSARSGRFSAHDRGKEITIYDSSISGNNSTVKIAAIINRTTVLTDPRLAVDAGPLRWEMRQPAVVDNSVITIEVRGGDVGSITPGWQLFDGASTFEIVARRRFRERFRERKLLTDKEGGDATIDALGRLNSPTAGFIQGDVGRPVSLTESTVNENNAIWEIKKVISPTLAELTVPATEATLPCRWAFFPFPVIEIKGPALPRGIVEQESNDLQGVAPSTFKSLKSKFTAADVGKRLSARGSTAIPPNDGVYEIATVVGANEVTVTAVTVQNEAAGMTWELRTSTIVGDSTQVDTNAPSMLALLAQDFGLTIDSQEVEKRQRAWVQHVTVWIDRKGVSDAYQLVAAISGFDATVTALYHISSDLVSIIPAANLYELGDLSVGRSGLDGHLIAGTAGRTRLQSGTTFVPGVALFVPGDVGKLIRVSGTPPNANDKLYEIETVIDALTVEFRLLDTATLPDARTLIWAIVSLYTTLPPAQPLFDEINHDLMLTLQAPGAYGLDMFCWETDPVQFSTDVPLVITAVTAPSLDVWDVVVTGNADVVVRVGSWRIVDAASVEFFLETVPSVSGPGFTFQVRSSQAPALGAAVLSYLCPITLNCNYCQSNKVLVVLTPNDILNDSGVAVERVYDRVLTRLNEEVKPAHIELVEELHLNIGVPTAFSVTLEQTIP